MTKEQAIELVLSIAKNEVGYLEKRSNKDLDSKTANAGSSNYTKYWRDIKPDYQGEPWCACYVTWCLVQAFGKEVAKKLLKHYPYVYCPTMESLFKLNSNPKTGDIVIFKHNGIFTHTGLVSGVDGDYFTTYEGNTSGGSTIIANGGGVCSKGYYNSNLPGTKFITLDWSIVSDIEVDTEKKNWADPYYNALMASGKITDKEVWSQYGSWLRKSDTVVVLDRFTSDKPWESEESDPNIHWCQPSIISLCGKGIIKDKSQWLDNSDAWISKALLLALMANIVDNNSGELANNYMNIPQDHWARNCLNFLCDKRVIFTPEAWCDDFDGVVTRDLFMALVCNVFHVEV